MERRRYRDRKSIKERDNIDILKDIYILIILFESLENTELETTFDLPTHTSE